MKVSDQGLAFLAAHEGFVSRGYLDPAGIVTIGYGFTMRSRVFSSWWRQRTGQSLRVGDSLARTDANKLLLKLLEEEYAPPVLRRFHRLSQPQFDACVSVVYNLGAGALGWRWAQALADGLTAKAASLLRKTGTRAGGRVLKGLVRRRAAEARLIETGDYRMSKPPLQSCDDVRQLQRNLQKLSFDPGPLDGICGPMTHAAITAFQKAHPPLVVDGVAGPATMATLKRALETRAGQAFTGAAALLSGGVCVSSGVPSHLAAMATGLVGGLGCGLLVLWLYRGHLLARIPSG
ncbi:lysozyme [Roseibium denhamense]|uniref:Lysozyme n=1 Tax=Roseibium denhamense TaxID=76305 RepID=A0ABY1PM34_9HYPH|nr:peptidoglycan-binding protein [Roseibium denhamense]MTI05721.1 lysozyme [Roseibium denhamense]SMP36946.1 Phage-related lysozyme (muramidase), GH24 family [Roseibium denhamense]